MLTKLEAENALKPHISKIGQSLDGGWKAWHAHYKPRHPILDARARAAIVYCEIIALAKELFTNDADVKIVKRGLTYLIYVGDHIILRFKKSRNGKPSNIRTGQQVLFQQQTFETMFPSTLVSACYELDNLEQTIESLIVIAQMNGKSVWSLDISIGEAGADENKVTFMSGPSPQDKPKPSRVVARNAKKRKDSESE